MIGYQRFYFQSFLYTNLIYYFHPLLLFLLSLFLTQKVESTNMKKLTVQIMQLSFFMLLGNICWKIKWSWAATFVTKSLEIPLLHFESSWDTLIFSHFLDVVINQGSSLHPGDSCLICINKYWEVVSTDFSFVLTRELKQVTRHSARLEVKVHCAKFDLILCSSVLSLNMKSYWLHRILWRVFWVFLINLIFISLFRILSYDISWIYSIYS